MLAYSNPQNVVVVKSPSGTNESKRFLGYEWSSRKGAEGIKYTGTAAGDDTDDETLSRLKGIKRIQTPLFNPADLSDISIINTAIRYNFNGLTYGESEFIYRFRLVDMLDFSEVKFEKAISLSAVSKVEIVSKFPVISLTDQYVAINDSSINPSFQSNQEYTYVDITSVESKTGVINYNNKILGKNAPSRARRIAKSASSLISTVRPNLKSFAFIESEMPNTLYSTDFAIIRSMDETILLNKYIYEYFMNLVDVMDQIEASMPKGQYPSINESDIRNIRIPLPPIDIQRKIVSACEAVDAEYKHTRESIEEYRGKIEQLFNNMESVASIDYNLRDGKMFALSIGKRILDTQLIPDGEVPVYSANVFEPFGYINERLITDFDIPSVLWGIDGDWQVNYIPAGIEFYPTDHCGVLRILTDDVHPRYLKWVLDNAGKERGFTRSLRASISRVKRLTVQLPPIDIQREIVEKVFEYENQIAEKKARLDELNKERQKVLDEHLR